MNPVEIAIQTMAGYRATLDLARWAEANGVVALAAADHYLTSSDKTSDPALDQLTVLAAVAAGTSTLGLATLVSPITFRQPPYLHRRWPPPWRPPGAAAGRVDPVANAR